MSNFLVDGGVFFHPQIKESRQQSSPLDMNRSQKKKAMNADSTTAISKIRSVDFYEEYHGHTIEHLQIVQTYFEGVKSNGGIDGIIYFAGDSSLDNKYWFKDSAAAVNGYEHILTPARSRKDISYWMNFQEQQAGSTSASDTHDGRRYAAINCSVEESTVGARSWGRLLPQDEFIKQHITGDDVLVVSVGGNDIALKPSPCTIVNMLTLVNCVPFTCLQNYTCGCALPCDDYLFGCCTSCASDLLAFPCGIGYFVHLFRTRIEAYLANMLGLSSFLGTCKRNSSTTNTTTTTTTKVRKVLICMIYYPDEMQTGSWADKTLGALGYSSDPSKLQLVIRTIFKMATNQISLPGIQVTAVPLFSAMDGKTSDYYSQRVEPSAVGGEYMSALIGKAVHDPTPTGELMKSAFAEHEAAVAARAGGTGTATSPLLNDGASSSGGNVNNGTFPDVTSIDR